MSGSQTRSVQFDRYNGLDVLHLAGAAMPQPAAGEVVVAVQGRRVVPSQRFPESITSGARMAL